MALMKISGKSDYLRSLLLPATGPADIPDDKVRLHALRGETVTYNFSAGASGSGLFVLQPNNPRGFIGAHYKYETASSKYVFDSNMFTAQDLPTNYDYGRKVSQIVTIRSSTLPAGVYALNGTFNAVSVEGTPSELTPITYGNVLSATADVIDKVGNALVGDGIAILALPSTLDIPYVRMGDPTPATYLSGITSCVATSPALIQPEAESLVVNIDVGCLPFTYTNANRGSPETVYAFSQNLDSTEGIICNLTALFTFDVPATFNNFMGFSITVQTLDLFGSITDTFTSAQTFNVQTAASDGNRILVSLVSPIMGCAPLNNNKAPTAAVKVIANTTSVVGSGPKPLPNMSVKVVGSAHALAASMPGMNMPTSLVAYQQVAAGTAITVSGVSNFELIPNPELRKNLPVKYGKVDPTELDYVKTILGMRDRLELRTVWPLKLYEQRSALLGEMSDLNKHEVATAFSFGDIIAFLKKAARFALPIASAAFPAISPIAGILNSYLTEEQARAASGRAIAASGVSIAASRRKTLLPTAYAMDTLPEGGFPNSAVFLSNTTESLVGTPRALDGVLFPTINIGSEGGISRGQIWLAARGEHTDLVTNEDNTYVAETTNKAHQLYGRIYGLSKDMVPDAEKLPIRGEWTLLPLSGISPDRVFVQEEDQPQIAQNSYQAALCTASLMSNRGQLRGVPMALVTGAVRQPAESTLSNIFTLQIVPHEAAILKQELVAKPYGLPLLAAHNGDNILPCTNIKGCMDTLLSIKSPLARPFPCIVGGISYAADDFEFPPPPDFETQDWSPAPSVPQMSLIERWTDLAQQIEEEGLYPNMGKLMEIITWLDLTGNVDIMYRMTQRDPKGDRFANMLEPLTYPEYAKPGHPTPAQAMEEKARNMMTRLRSQYPEITTDWIVSNGYRGPSEEQAKYRRSNGVLPQVGHVRPIAEPVDRKLDQAVQRMIDANKKITPLQAQQLKDYANSRGKLPDATDYKEILGVNSPSLNSGRAEMRAERATRTAERRGQGGLLGRYTSVTGGNHI